MHNLFIVVRDVLDFFDFGNVLSNFFIDSFIFLLQIMDVLLNILIIVRYYLDFFYFINNFWRLIFYMFIFIFIFMTLMLQLIYFLLLPLNICLMFFSMSFKYLFFVVKVINLFFQGFVFLYPMVLVFLTISLDTLFKWGLFFLFISFYLILSILVLLSLLILPELWVSVFYSIFLLLLCGNL